MRAEGRAADRPRAPAGRRPRGEPALLRGLPRGARDRAPARRADHFAADELYVDAADGVRQPRAPGVPGGGPRGGRPVPRRGARRRRARQRRAGRAPYHPGYYAAFLLDPDGNNIEAVHHGPADPLGALRRDHARRRRVSARRHGAGGAGPAHRRGADGHPEHHPALRRRDRDPRRQLRHPRGRDPGDHRPERRRQVVDAERDQRLLPPAGGRDLVPRRAARADAAARDRAPGDRAHLPEHRALQGHDDARQHHDRALHPHAPRHRLAGALEGPAEREEIANRAIVERIIDFLEIQAIRKTPVGRLPYGLQKRVELGRALAAEPKLLLLDEPMAGMNVEEKEDMCRFILDVNDEFGTTIALIEHDMGVVMDIADRVVVLDYGRKIGDGTPDEVRGEPGGDRRLSRGEPLRRDAGRAAQPDRGGPQRADGRRALLAGGARLRADLQGERASSTTPRGCSRSSRR